MHVCDCFNACFLQLMLLSTQTAKTRRTIMDSDKRKLQRRIAHSAPGSITVKPDRKKKILAQVE